MNRREHYRRAGGALPLKLMSIHKRIKLQPQRSTRLTLLHAAFPSSKVRPLINNRFVQMGCVNNAGVRRTVKPGEGIVGRTAAGNIGPVIVADPTKDEAFLPAVDVPGYGRDGADLESSNARANAGLMCGPVKDGCGGVWGVLVVAGPGGNDGGFDEESLKTFT